MCSVCLGFECISKENPWKLGIVCFRCRFVEGPTEVGSQYCSFIYFGRGEILLPVVTSCDQHPPILEQRSAMPHTFIADSARSINDLHEVVGRWDDSSMPLTIPCSTQCHGFYWARGEFRDVEFPGAVFTVALGINNTGFIVGRYADSSNIEHAFIAKRRAAHSTRDDDDDAFSQFESNSGTNR